MNWKPGRSYLTMDFNRRGKSQLLRWITCTRTSLSIHILRQYIDEVCNIIFVVISVDISGSLQFQAVRSHF